MEISLKSDDDVLILKVSLIFSKSGISLMLGGTPVEISPAIQYGQMVDIYIVCGEENFQVYIQPVS